MTVEPISQRRFFFRQAKKDGFAARSVYKLEEINQRDRLIRKGSIILDLGCAPGSWLQYAAKQVGPNGRIVGVDPTPVTVSLPSHVHVIQGDMYALHPDEIRKWAPDGFHLVMSDAAPKTTGIPFADHARSVELARRSLELAIALLRPGGSWLAKVFQGEDLPPLRDEARKRFRKFMERKPKSSRDRSVEVFLVGIGFGRPTE